MSIGPLMIDVAGLSLTAEDRELLCEPAVGGLILFARNFESRAQVRRLIDEVHAARGAPEKRLLIAVDQEGGRVQRFKTGFTELPPLRWLGRLYDESPSEARLMAATAARVMATEVLDAGVDFSFAPCVDIDRECCEVIGDRALHTQPEAVAALSLAYMQGMRQAGMAAVAKHFPGHGGVIGDSHLVLPEDHRSYSDLLDDMRPYTTLIDDGLEGAMMAHIRYTEVDPQIASLSRYWMQTILRDQLGFSGAIFSDDLSMKGASVGGSVAERAVLALDAGADMVLVCNDRDSVPEVVAALSDRLDPVAHARLAAMRANPERYAADPYNGERWQTDLAVLQAALATPPPFKLDGNS